MAKVLGKRRYRPLENRHPDHPYFADLDELKDFLKYLETHESLPSSLQVFHRTGTIRLVIKGCIFYHGTEGAGVKYGKGEDGSYVLPFTLWHPDADLGQPIVKEIPAGEEEDVDFSIPYTKWLKLRLQQVWLLPSKSSPVFRFRKHHLCDFTNLTKLIWKLAEDAE